MKFLSKSRTLLASLALAALAGGAQADVVQIRGYVANGTAYADLATAPNVYNGIAALWSVTKVADNTSFLAYCLQLMENIDRAGSNDYTSSTYAPGATVMTDVQELYDRYYGSVTQTVSRAVGFQLALWDLTGEIDVTSFVAPTNAIAEAKLMLDGVANATAPYTQNAYRFTRWSNNGLQDVLQANEVPEPQTHALLLGGLGLMAAGMASRRRKNDKARKAA